jgi:signal transduction histidine kinase
LANALRSGAKLDRRLEIGRGRGCLSHGKIALPEEIEQHLLRIAQEAVANVLKHGNAGQIWVKLQVESGSVSLCVIDNGRGF